MGDVGDYWREHREYERKTSRAAAIGPDYDDVRTNREIKRLERAGYTVRKFTAYQYRVNEAIDIYPISKKFHDVRENKRGDYLEFDDVIKFVRSQNLRSSKTL